MAEKASNFRSGSYHRLKIFKADQLAQIFQGLSLSPKTQEQSVIKKRQTNMAFDLQFQPCNLKLQNNKNFEISLSKNTPPIKPKIDKMKYFDMLYNFKFQNEESRIQVFHELLYELSINKNIISQLFVQMLPEFVKHKTSFSQEIGCLLKFAKDKENHYAINYLSQLITKVTQDIPEVRVNRGDLKELLVILIEILKEITEQNSGLHVFKTIYTVALFDEQIGGTLLKKDGQQIISYICQNFDYSLEYMLIKILKHSDPSQQILSFIITKFMELYKQQNSKAQKNYPCKKSYNSSIFRVIKQVQQILAKKMNKKIAELINNKKNLYLLKELYEFQNYKSQQLEILKTQILIKQFKKMRISQRQEAHQLYIKKIDLQNQYQTFGRKIIKRSMEEQ